MIPQFDTLDEVVRATFPPEFCRVVAVREHEDAAVALFDTRPSVEPYPYQVHYYRENGRWSEGSSSTGSGWHLLDPETDLGVETAWGEVPPGADSARFTFGGETREEPVSNGFISPFGGMLRARRSMLSRRHFVWVATGCGHLVCGSSSASSGEPGSERETRKVAA